MPDRLRSEDDHQQRQGKERTFKHNRWRCQQGFGTQFTRGDRRFNVGLLGNVRSFHRQRVQACHALCAANQHHQTCQHYQ